MTVLGLDDLVELLDQLGMKIELDLDAGAAEGDGRELVTARLAHALVGVVEAHATQAEEAARQAGADTSDIAEVALMAFAGANCSSESDEWALLEWRVTRLAMVLTGLDFTVPLPREGQVGSGDVLVKTIRMVTAALSGMVSAKHAAVNPLLEPGTARDAGLALSRAMDARTTTSRPSSRAAAVHRWTVRSDTSITEARVSGRTTQRRPVPAWAYPDLTRAQARNVSGSTWWRARTSRCSPIAAGTTQVSQCSRDRHASIREYAPSGAFTWTPRCASRAPRSS